jgi:hypothetical protein
MSDRLLEPRLQLIVVQDDLLRMDGFNRRDRHDEVPGILDPFGLSDSWILIADIVPQIEKNG